LREIEQMTLWELNDLMAYWKENPPTHVLVAAYLIGGGKKGPRKNLSPRQLSDLSQAVASAGGMSLGKLPSVYRA
jgi:hypothetical protein